MAKLLIEVECGMPDHNECGKCQQLKWPDGMPQPFCPLFKDRYGQAVELRMRYGTGYGKVYRSFACLAAEQKAKEKP